MPHLVRSTAITFVILQTNIFFPYTGILYPICDHPIQCQKIAAFQFNIFYSCFLCLQSKLVLVQYNKIEAQSSVICIHATKFASSLLFGFAPETFYFARYFPRYQNGTQQVGGFTDYLVLYNRHFFFELFKISGDIQNSPRRFQNEHWWNPLPRPCQEDFNLRPCYRSIGFRLRARFDWFHGFDFTQGDCLDVLYHKKNFQRNFKQRILV